MKFALALIFATAHADTIAQLLAKDPNLSKISALSKDRPDWSNAAAKVTLMAPNDAAIAAAGNTLIGPGYFFMNRVFSFEAHYEVLQDADGVKMLLWDNYTPEQKQNPEVHIRFGLGNGLVRQFLQADNGWLYVTDLAISPPSPPSKSFDFLGCTQFRQAIEKVGLTEFVDGLRGVTIFAPNDAAFAASADAVKGLSTNQLKAVILYHIIPQVVYSTQMNSGTLPTLLEGNTIPVKSSPDGADVGPGPYTGRFSLADNFMTSGVTHRLGFIMIPPNLPKADANVVPTNVPTGSIPPGTKPNTSGTGTNSTTSGTPKPSSNDARGQSATIGTVLSTLFAIFAL